MNESIEKTKSKDATSSASEVFKKPVFIGKVGKLPKKVPLEHLTKTPCVTNKTSSGESKPDGGEPCQSQATTGEEDHLSTTATLRYEEPEWSGVPKVESKPYQFDVLKCGSIIETIDLMTKSHYVFGRLGNCDIPMQHPTISRYHAVLQYRNTTNDRDNEGFYIYDLGSTHGTFLNKTRLRPKVYTKVHVGHMLKLGCSSRVFILNGPEEDAEMESELSVTELKQKREDDIRKLEEQQIRKQQEIEEQQKRDEERGVDWGMGEDADEETDLSENPYAQTTNEELYLDDPKKALRGFFEREGLEFEYDCSEQGIGQFLCKVELPIDDERGRPVFAEVIHKGKKKEAVVQCALEACRILDRHGLLRQSVHESRKRKSRNWEENDYYDSDDDTFLDRTGTIEKKREKRMNAKLPQKVETYESLMAKEQEISEKIKSLEKDLLEAQRKLANEVNDAKEEDSLDSFMQQLTHSKPDKQTINKLKTELSKLKQEHANVIRLVNIAKPANLPPLNNLTQLSQPSTSNAPVNNRTLPIFGKRKKIKVQLPAKPTNEQLSNVVDNDDEEEEEENDVKNINPDSQMKPTELSSGSPSIPASKSLPESIAENQEHDTPRTEDEKCDLHCTNSNSGTQSEMTNENYSSDTSLSSDDGFEPQESIGNNLMTFKKFEKLLNSKSIPQFPEEHQDKLAKILNNLKKLATDEDRMHTDWKTLVAKKRKVMKLIFDMKKCEEPDERMEHKVSAELKRILNELNTMMEQKYKVIKEVKKMGHEIKNISDEVNKSSPKAKCDDVTSIGTADGNDDSVKVNEEAEVDSGKKKRKNLRRIQQRQERVELDRQRGYEEDASREDYNMWVPPSNQTGDGRTNLNEKYGY